jgi:hypothetical protein
VNSFLCQVFVVHQAKHPILDPVASKRIRPKSKDQIIGATNTHYYKPSFPVPKDGTVTDLYEPNTFALSPCKAILFIKQGKS